MSKENIVDEALAALAELSRVKSSRGWLCNREVAGQGCHILHFNILPCLQTGLATLFLRVAFLVLGRHDLLAEVINPFTHYHMGFDLDDVSVNVDILTDLMQAAHRGRMHVHE